jgi:Ca2+-transporting ATPase
MHWQTIVFNFLCLSQLGHVLAIRSEKQPFLGTGMFSNKLLTGSVLFTLFLQLFVTYLPLLQPVFNTESLTPDEFILVTVSAAVVVAAVVIEKIILKRKINPARHY